MVPQVGIGVYGFYAIRHSKNTVPVTVVIMALMSRAGRDPYRGRQLEPH